VAQEALQPEIPECDIETTPDKQAVHLQLSAVTLIKTDNAGAKKLNLQIVKCDREYREDTGRKGYGALCNELEYETEAVKNYHTLLV
jgi:hypothetical protein